MNIVSCKQGEFPLHSVESTYCFVVSFVLYLFCCTVTAIYCQLNFAEDYAVYAQMISQAETVFILLAYCCTVVWTKVSTANVHIIVYSFIYNYDNIWTEYSVA